jgi:ABC-2 type transport system ATP-binding protein
MSDVLKTESLTKKFGMKTAVDSVSMTIKKGEIYGFIGRNGAGKTTFMRMVLGMAFPDSGTIELFGEKVTPASRRRIGSLVEAPGIYHECNAYENLKRASMFCGGSDDRVKEILDFVGLSDTGSKKAGDFSLGMKQRLGIGIALLGDPEFLVLDEPVNGLDPAGIKEVRDIILDLNRNKGMTVLISSHLLDELAKIVGRYGIINNGALVEELSADELKKRCENSLKMKVSDTASAMKILGESLNIKDASEENGYIILKSDNENAGEINRVLVSSGITVSRIEMNNDDPEDYFIKRIGNNYEKTSRV